MKFELIECTLVFLVPLFIASAINNFSPKVKRANLKIVFYKFFLFCAILFVASQIPLRFIEGSSLGVFVRIIGNVLMALLIFEFFLIPDENTHPDDMVVIHNSVLWMVIFLFLVMCCVDHYPSIADPKYGWKFNPVYDLFKISNKVYTDLTFPKPQSQYLPICNIFSFVNTITDSKQITSIN